ncbi:MAG: hypothetical protein PF542_05580 [Nanoarchaeota archaeon]|jgi:hypothetical protein|nr:hypothetical protein [Nanoarchaeota archaeon]
MNKIQQLKELVQRSGTDKMKELVTIAENYIEGLNNMFKNRDVSQFVLAEVDFLFFVKELQEKGLFKNKGHLMAKVMIKDALFIVRHTWEFTGKDGKLKTGDNLRKEWPLMFEDDEIMEVEELFKQLQYL